MRVPTRTRVSPPPGSQSLSTFRVRPVSNASAVSDAAGNLGQTVSQGLTRLGLHLREQQDKDERFAAGVAFSNFTREQSAAQQIAINESPPGDMDFARGADETFVGAKDAFLRDRIPPRLQGEFDFRATQVRQSLNSAALKHQFESSQQFYETRSADKLSELQQTVKDDPTTLRQAQDEMTQFINETTLPGLRKAKLGNASNDALAAVVYQAEIKSMMLDVNEGGPGRQIIGSVADSINTAANRHGVSASTLKTIAWLESRGNPLAENPRSSAGGLFQLIDTTAKRFGVTDKFDVDQSADAAAKLLAENRSTLAEELGREPSVGELYLAHQQGARGAIRLLSNPNANAAAIVGEQAVVLNGGQLNMTASDFAKIWINKAEASVDETDTRFQQISFDDRRKLRAAAETEARRDITENQKATKLARASAHDNLLNRIIDGSASQDDIERDNELFGFTAAQRLQQRRVFDGIDKDAKGRARIETILNSLGSTYNLSKDAKDFNRWFNGIGNLDEAGVRELSDAVRETNDIPTNAIGLFDSMSRSSDIQEALNGFQMLEQLQAASPQAFDARVSAPLRDRFDRYQAAKSTSEGEELVGFAQGSRDLLQAQANPVFDKEAKEALDDLDIAHEFADSVQPFFQFEGTLGNVVAVGPRLERAGRAAFMENYRITRDATKAKMFMLSKLNRTWGVTFQGDQGGIIAELPVEKIYPAVPGGSSFSSFFGSREADPDYQAYQDQARQDLGLKSGETYELLADDQTRRELFAANGGQLNRLPSYRVLVFDENGEPRVVGQRWFGQVPE